MLLPPPLWPFWILSNIFAVWRDCHLNGENLRCEFTLLHLLIIFHQLQQYVKRLFVEIIAKSGKKVPFHWMAKWKWDCSVLFCSSVYDLSMMLYLCVRAFELFEMNWYNVNGKPALIWTGIWHKIGGKKMQYHHWMILELAILLIFLLLDNPLITSRCSAFTLAYRLSIVCTLIPCILVKKKST